MSLYQTPIFKKVMATGILLVILMGILSAWAWVRIPEGQKIPVHWGINGEVDRYGSKAEGLLLLPGICAGLLVLFSILPLIEPRRLNLENSSKAYSITILAMMVFMTCIHGIMVLSAQNVHVDVGRWINVLLGIMFVIMGNYLTKIRSNFFFGIRTPWTLSSELSWKKTHRLGGKLFVVFGVLLLVAPFFAPPRGLFFILVGGVITVTVVSVVYSYLVWRKDPNRHGWGQEKAV